MPAAVRASQPTLEFARNPMPVGGLNFVDNVMALTPEFAYVLDNFVARPFGCEVRKGWRYWMAAGNTFAGPIRTIMTFNARTSANSKLFACPAITDSPIYDISITNTAPVVSLTPTTPPTVLGEYYHTNYVTPGGAFLAVVAAGMGYASYSTTGWVQYTIGDGIVANTIKFPANDTTTLQQLCFVWSWKNRLWFLKKDSTVAYYLPIGQLYGELKAFDFGAQLDHGGALAYGTNWTYDGGDGMDDGLVIVTTEGEILVYQGTDPSSIETFAMKGVWYAGRPPYGRRGYHTHGGDLLIITEYGIIRMTDLVSGKLHTSDLSYNGLGGRINPRLARFVSETINSQYWFILPYPTEELLVVGSPYIDVDRSIRITYVMNSLGNGWSTFSKLDMLDAQMWEGRMVFGMRDGNVGQGFDNYRDGDSADGATLGDNILGSLQTNFNDYGSPNFNKTVRRAKVYGVVANQPSIYLTFQPEYNFTLSQLPGVPIADARALWDVSLWDAAFWATASATLGKWFGTAAFGKKMSLQLVTQVNSACLLTDYETCFTKGYGL